MATNQRQSTVDRLNTFAMLTRTSVRSGISSGFIVKTKFNTKMMIS